MSETLATPDVRELVDNVELVGIKFLHLSGQAKSGEVEVEEAEGESTADVAISIQESHDVDKIEVRFRVRVDHSQADYEIELMIRYMCKVPYSLDHDVLRDFIEKVAIMAAFPYMREAISSTAARLELEVPMLGLLRQGEFSLGPAESE